VGTRLPRRREAEAEATRLRAQIEVLDGPVQHEERDTIWGLVTEEVPAMVQPFNDDATLFSRAYRIEGEQQDQLLERPRSGKG
jgi:hypothetical protein